ncbi:MAG: hypothetical protein ACOX9C_07075 [Kiritimatiellia bacterium]|jgi:hypothetical protein
MFAIFSKAGTRRRRRRRRPFRYRPMHAFHLDLVMVLLLTVAGWALWPKLRSTTISRSRAQPMTVEICNATRQTTDALLHAPTLFAFRSSVGFSGDGPLPGDAAAEAPSLRPPADPAFAVTDFLPPSAPPSHWPGDATVLRARPPAAPPLGLGAPPAPPSPRRPAVRCMASEPDVIVPDVSDLELRTMAGRSIWAHVTFGADGAATAAVLSRHALPPTEALRLERRAMAARASSAPSCQLVFQVAE